MSRKFVLCETQSCVRACNSRTAFIKFNKMINVMHVSVILLFVNVHNNVSKFDRVINCITKRATRERELEPSRVPAEIFMKVQKKRKNRKKLKAFVKSRFSVM